MSYIPGSYNIFRQVISKYQNFGVILIAGLAGFSAAFVLGPGPDYFFHYRPEVELTLSGKMYAYPVQFFNTPWLAWLLLPLQPFPVELANALLGGVSLAIILAGLLFTTKNLDGYAKLLVIILGLINLVNFDLINRGQIDALPLLGILLAWPGRNWFQKGCGYSLMVIKPPNTIPLLIFFLYLDFKENKYNLNKAVLNLLPLAVVTLISFVLHGDWPLRLLKLWEANPSYDTWRVTLWRLLQLLNIPQAVGLFLIIPVCGLAAWVFRQTTSVNDRIGLVLITTFMITPYALTYHFVLILVFIFPLLVRDKNWWVIVLWLLTFLPVLRPLVGPQLAILDLLFVIAVYFCLIYQIVFRSKKLSIQ